MPDVPYRRKCSHGRQPNAMPIKSAVPARGVKFHMISAFADSIVYFQKTFEPAKLINGLGRHIASLMVKSLLAGSLESIG